MDISKEINQLTTTISQSDCYKKYTTLYEKSIRNNPENKKMLQDFRMKVYEYEMKKARDGKVDENEMSKIQALQNILFSNSELKEYFIAEMEVAQMVQSVQEAIEKLLRLE